MEWEAHARRLADAVVRPESRWWKPIAATPRHVFVPRWWERAPGGRVVRDGAADVEAWLKSAYADNTLVTRLGPVHADQAEPGHRAPPGSWPTSSSTLPTLIVTMYRHAMLADGCTTLVTTGTGYGTALACHRLGAELVTSVDIDDYLVQAAADRLGAIGLHPHTAVCDLTQKLPGEVDRIVSTVSVRPVPISWLDALRPDGRLVTTITGTGLILIADKKPDGGARGRIAPTGAWFMAARHGADRDDISPSAPVWEAADGDGEDVSTSRYPLLYVPDSWAVQSMLELEIPGIEHRSQRGDDGGRTVWMAHPDGSWARAHADGPLLSPTVHQGGPRRLWDVLERIRDRLNTWGDLPVYGSAVTITPDGQTTLSRGPWSAPL
ncbi:protein-L-isoaspartate(D-aspartate) O-methyltransferase [Streptomyces sp. MNP-20]|uniref:protein-L-isoaspartate(D-aspartate) O-methyltransferase n=1 Tax=Streptomyces sp. MNP-20 TaxID=2721165 RepID=UPI001557A193|nr:protein-L-isoaspartate(D-aspartate) O-methyltransferase [Streptomyces sp. MNP-20]